MRKILFLFVAVAAVMAGCNDYETYGDKKEKERNAIAKFIADSSIVVISEDQFNRQGQTTNVERNEFVKLDKTGVYMQIVRSGCGTAIQDGESTNLVCRYSEYDILNDTLYSCNNDPRMAYYGMSVVSVPDLMHVTRAGSTYTAYFTDGIMYAMYGASVPAGWLVPLNYVKVGRPESLDEECAKVRLIVPHSQGNTNALSYVMPFFYTITFQRES